MNIIQKDIKALWRAPMLWLALALMTFISYWLLWQMIDKYASLQANFAMLSNPPTVTNSLWVPYVLLLAKLMMLLVAYSSSFSFAQERGQHTLWYLLINRNSCVAVIAQKFIAQMVILLFVALLLVIVVFITLLKSLMMHQTDVSLNAISYFELFRAPFHYAITSILIGVLVAIISQGSTVKAQPTLFWVSVLGAFGILCWANLYQAENWHLLNGLHLLMVLMFGLMIWTAVQFSGAPWLKWLTGRTLRTISVLSYAWYLAHYTVLPWVYRLHRGYIRSEEPWIHTLSFLAIYVGISLLFSLLLHYLIEKPFLLWKDRV